MFATTLFGQIRQHIPYTYIRYSCSRYTTHLRIRLLIWLSRQPEGILCEIQRHPYFEERLNGRFNRLTSDILLEKTWMWLKRGNLKIETEYLIPAQNNAIRTNQINARIYDNKKSRCRLYGDRDKTTKHISECNKLAQKEYKTRHDWVGKVIHWGLYKKLKFDHTNK